MKGRNRSAVLPVLSALVNGTWYLLAAALALTIVLSLGGASIGTQFGPGAGTLDIDAAHSNVSMAIPVALRTDDRVTLVSAPGLGIEHAELRDLQGTLRFPPRRGAFFVANLIFAVTSLGFGLWVLSLLRSLIRGLRAGHPFRAGSASRVRTIGWAVILGEVVRAAVVYFENRYAMTHFTAPGLEFLARPDLNGFALVHGLIILALAEVFRAGARLDDEQSLTV